MNSTLNEKDYFGAKADKGKIRAALILQDFPKALQAIATVATFGANKYAAHSWQDVPDAHVRYEDAMTRHWLAYCAGEEFDPESGLPHFAHFAWGALAILELEMRNAYETEKKMLKPLQ